MTTMPRAYKMILIEILVWGSIGKTWREDAGAEQAENGSIWFQCRRTIRAVHPSALKERLLVSTVT